jgi:hypothetical protein
MMLEMVEQYYGATQQPCPVTYLAKRSGLHHETARERVAALFSKGFVLAPGSPVTPASPVAIPRDVPGRNRQRHVIYLLLNPTARLVKIGRTIRLEDRVRELKRAAGKLVMLIGACDASVGDGNLMTELCWHRRFAAARVTGEWFSITPDLRDEIATRFGIDLAHWDSSGATG